MAQIDVRIDYDKDADVLYITLGTGESSYCEEVDDILLVERGLLSNNITGFRILDVRHHGIREVGLQVLKLIEEQKPRFWLPHVETLKKRFESDRLKNMVHA